MVDRGGGLAMELFKKVCKVHVGVWHITALGRKESIWAVLPSAFVKRGDVCLSDLEEHHLCPAPVAQTVKSAMRCRQIVEKRTHLLAINSLLLLLEAYRKWAGQNCDAPRRA